MLRQIVREWAGSSADLAEVRPLDGGSISTTAALQLQDGQRARPLIMRRPGKNLNPFRLFIVVKFGPPRLAPSPPYSGEKRAG